MDVNDDDDTHLIYNGYKIVFFFFDNETEKQKLRCGSFDKERRV